MVWELQFRADSRLSTSQGKSLSAISVLARLCKGKGQKQGLLFSLFITEGVNDRNEPQETSYFILRMVCKTACSGSWSQHCLLCWEVTEESQNGLGWERP